MRLQILIAAVLGWVSCAVATSNNLTDLVVWDNYSLTVNGERVYIRFGFQSGWGHAYANILPALQSSITKDYQFPSSGWYNALP